MRTVFENAISGLAAAMVTIGLVSASAPSAAFAPIGGAMTTAVPPGDLDLGPHAVRAIAAR